SCSPVTMPICKVKQKTSPEPPCPVANSRLTSGLLKIAGLLEEGGVCGIPTDTVYALAASCKNPQAIEKIYNIKVRLKNVLLVNAKYGTDHLISLETHQPFSYDLCIVSKGDWLFRLGKHIMIRVPDHTVTGHLCDMTGPLAITSANPSGEADSTHHSMPFIALSTGTITIVREGCVPALKVQQIFDRVKSTML
uniref:Threonylcarbamoyl-AMP synthase n=1 Tax=Acanthochromis polyacanthus TaxID=80966 RepID=A0A3Q1G4W7_9TELE